MTITDRLRQLEETLHHEIPLTRQLGVTVESYDGARLRLRAPLAPNINHKDTAFAGSLNAVVTLAGWGLLWLILQEEGLAAKIVIQDSAVNYLLPISTDFSADCYQPDPALLAKFVRTLRRHGQARLELEVEIRSGDQLALRFKGRYVAQAFVK